MCNKREFEDKVLFARNRKECNCPVCLAAVQKAFEQKFAHAERLKRIKEIKKKRELSSRPWREND
jgi:hypothetical protein